MENKFYYFSFSMNKIAASQKEVYKKYKQADRYYIPKYIKQYKKHYNIEDTKIIDRRDIHISWEDASSISFSFFCDYIQAQRENTEIQYRIQKNIFIEKIIKKAYKSKNPIKFTMQTDEIKRIEYPHLDISGDRIVCLSDEDVDIELHRSMIMQKNLYYQQLLDREIVMITQKINHIAAYRHTLIKDKKERTKINQELNNKQYNEPPIPTQKALKKKLENILSLLETRRRENKI